MSRISLLAAILLCASMTMPVQAEDVTAGSLKISAPWARATPKGAQVGGGYLTITNTGTTPDHLIGGASEVADKFEIHEMSMDEGVMKMRGLPSGLVIKPGETVVFKPTGYHIMLKGLKQQLIKGQHFKASLQFEKAGKVDVDFTIESIGAMKAEGVSAPHAGHDMPGMKMK